MLELVHFNGVVMPATDARIIAASSAALYGKGVFTTVAVAGSRPLLWEKHWKRLCRDSAKIGIDISKHSERPLVDAVSEVVEANGITNGRTRVSFFDETPAPLWIKGGMGKCGLLVSAAGQREIPKNFRLSLSSYRINSASPLAGVKSCNYLDKLLAFDEAKRRGFDEAVQLNECGRVASACMANIFWLQNGKLHTPSLKSGCLAGTTREFVMENFECVEIEEGPDSLTQADAIFLTSAALGVTTVSEFDGRRLPRTDHEITSLLGRSVK